MELYDGTVSDTLGGIAGNGDPVTSFVSEQNTNVTAVQFALKTAAIKAPEAVTKTEPEAAPTTFWQKLTALFGF